MSSTDESQRRLGRPSLEPVNEALNQHPSDRLSWDRLLHRPQCLLVEGFRQGLRELGWVEGQTIAVDYRFAEGRFDLLPDRAAGLVRLKVHIIAAGPTPAAVAAKNATGTIPIVMWGVGDPVGLGLIASLACPGGNVTGWSLSLVSIRPRSRSDGAHTMKISATVTSSASTHEVTVRTGTVSQSLAVPAKVTGRGSSINGGEFLMLALATCYCNDLYREAERLRIPIQGAQVEATAEFPGTGLAATNIRYRAVVKSSANAEAIGQLLRETDAVAEVHNTVRAGVPVELLPQ